MSSNTQIRISTDTRDALREVGNMGDTYDILICKMIDTYRVYMEFVTNRSSPDNCAPDPNL